MKLRILPIGLLAFAISHYASAQTPAAVAAVPIQYDFGSGVIPVYSAERGYGFINTEDIRAVPAGGNKVFKAGALTSAKPFIFVINLPEGNYAVTLHLGDPSSASNTTIKAESRRLMLEAIKADKGATVTRTFMVNIRMPEIAGGGKKVSLKPGEIGSNNWDDKLTLEFNGPHPAVSSMEIRRTDTAMTVYLAGDSTVTDQGNEPWCSWGQMLPRFFNADTAVENLAQSGLSLGSFRRGNRLEKILSTLKSGEYVLIQFGHNDMKEKNSGAFTTYADNLRQYIDDIKAKQGKPVLVTPMYRRRFDKQGNLVSTHGDYPEAVRKVAKEKNVPCIDLHAMSARVFTALGVEKSKAAFVFYPANTFPNQTKDLADNSHFCAYGAYELARCIVEGIRANIPELAARLAPDAGKYNPDRPGNPAVFDVPPSPPSSETTTPEGS